MNLKELFEKQDKEFEEKFRLKPEEYALMEKRGVFGGKEQLEKFQSHISKIRQETLQAVREEIEGLIRLGGVTDRGTGGNGIWCTDCEQIPDCCECGVYHQALEDVLEALK